MLSFKAFLVTSVAVASLLASTASYSSNWEVQALRERLERMERDLADMQKQHYGAPGAPRSPTNNAEIGVRFDELQNQLREIRGSVEEVQFSVRTLKQDQERALKDMEFRISDLEKSRSSGEESYSEYPGAQKKTEFSGTPLETKAPKEEEKPYAEVSETASAGDNVLSIPEKPAKSSDGKLHFKKSKDLYDHAFKLINKAEFTEAGHYLDEFIERFPKDPLIGNAYYWRGEVAYATKDYMAAADKFRLGFEAVPNGPKAPDNLLKLGMSLANLDKKKEACVVFTQVLRKFPNTSEGIKKNANSELQRNKCG